MATYRRTQDCVMTRELNEMTPEQQKLRDAFEQEAAPHIDSMYATALRLTKNTADAEDLVQESVLKAYRYFEKYEQGTNCKAWMFRIMTNTFINRYRKLQRRQEYLVPDGYRALQDRVENEEPNELHRFFEGESDMYFHLFSDEVKNALEEIPVDFRMVVLLADLQDFQYKEIAEIMDCPIGTVMSRLYRGRRMLRERLEDYALANGLVRSSAVASSSKESAQEDDEGEEGDRNDGCVEDLAAHRRRRLRTA